MIIKIVKRFHNADVLFWPNVESQNSEMTVWIHNAGVSGMNQHKCRGSVKDFLYKTADY